MTSEIFSNINDSMIVWIHNENITTCVEEKKVTLCNIVYIIMQYVYLQLGQVGLVDLPLLLDQLDPKH